MADITEAYTQQYRANLLVLFQQKGSKLRQFCMPPIEIRGKQAFWDRLGPAGEPNEDNTRYGDTPINEVNHSRRMITFRPYDWGHLIEKSDLRRVLIDPQSAYVQNAAYSLGRKIDKLIIEAALGTAYSGETGETTVGFPAGNVVAFTYGDTTGAMCVEKALRAARLLDEAEVPQEGRVIICHPRAIEQMLNTTKATSADYNSVKALVNGDINTFAGFTWVKSNLLPVSGSTVSAIAMVREAMGLAIGEEITTRVAEDPGKKFNTRIYVSMDAGATRIIDEGVIHIPTLYSV